MSINLSNSSTVNSLNGNNNINLNFIFSCIENETGLNSISLKKDNQNITINFIPKNNNSIESSNSNFNSEKNYNVNSSGSIKIYFDREDIENKSINNLKISDIFDSSNSSLEENEWNKFIGSSNTDTNNIYSPYTNSNDNIFKNNTPSTNANKIIENNLYNESSFSFKDFIKYGLLSYTPRVIDENKFEIEIFPLNKGELFLTNDTLMSLIADEINYYFYNNSLTSKDNINTLSEFAFVISNLFAISEIKNHSKNIYSFYAKGLDLSKSNIMKLLSDSNGSIPNVDSITIEDCKIDDRSDIYNMFEKGTKIIII